MIKLVSMFKYVIGLFSSDVKKRYEARYRVLSALVGKAGMRMYNRHLLWVSDQGFMDAWSRYPESTNVVPDRRFTLWSAANSVRSIPGDTAECGAFRGGGSYLILASQENVADKMHHIFDSFEGLSEPDARDDPSRHRTAFVWQKHDLAVEERVVAQNLSRFSNFRLYRGWIPNRFEEVAERRFCFVHVDVDLYQPTYDSIAFFYPRMSQGGIILCDDYGFTTCPGAKQAFDDYLSDKPESVIHLTTGQGVLIKH